MFFYERVSKDNLMSEVIFLNNCEIQAFTK